jgi:hypothetical protein
MFSSCPEWRSITIDYGVQTGGSGGAEIPEATHLHHT